MYTTEQLVKLLVADAVISFADKKEDERYRPRVMVDSKKFVQYRQLCILSSQSSDVISEILLPLFRTRVAIQRVGELPYPQLQRSLDTLRGVMRELVDIDIDSMDVAINSVEASPVSGLFNLELRFFKRDDTDREITLMVGFVFRVI